MNFWFSHFCSPHGQRTSCHVADLIFFSTQVLSTDHTTSVECGQRSLSNTEMSTFGSLYTTFVRACMYVIPLKLGLDLIKATYHYFSYFVVFFTCYLHIHIFHVLYKCLYDSLPYHLFL